MRTRFAPTPSGYLHQGNLANALLNSWLARSLGGECLLRIDADDVTRTRTEYVDYIHTALQALALNMTKVASPETDRAQYLRSQFDLIPQGQLFACTCSRSDLLDRPCTCRTKDIAWLPGVNTLRLRIDPLIEIVLEGEVVNLHEHFGDVVLWRRDDIPAYHWANVIDDRDLDITHIVRGRDLFPSSALHIYIRSLIGADSVASCTYLHHGLLTDPSGNKLSKSAQIHDRVPELSRSYLDGVYESAHVLAQQVGISPAHE